MLILAQGKQLDEVGCVNNVVDIELLMCCDEVTVSKP